MSLRTMSYDVAEYEKQAYLTRQKVKGKKNLSSGEFLSGFRKTDLKQIFNFIRNSRNGMKLKELLYSDSVYQTMDEASYDIITAFTHATELTNRKLEPSEEK